jgi:predicted metalloprotease with PDZ domain
MKYKISFAHPSAQYIHIEASIQDNSRPEIIFKIPSWRPGRYESSHFAQFLRDVHFVDSNQRKLPFRKISKDAWLVTSEGVQTVTARYDFYASILNAGSTWLSHTQLYVNPVNCLMYVEDRLGQPCDLYLNIPDNWSVATGMREKEKHVYRCSSYHSLADSPFIASDSLKHNSVEYANVRYTIWFQGESKIEWPRLKDDFLKIIREQVDTMGDFPTDRYHFLFQITPYKMYHGVEHLTSTVITLGPAYQLMKPILYNELLGISSHELFHAWNIKTIRPAEMLPYNYSTENYCRMGYVYEGVTSYYGDLFTFRAGVVNEAEFFRNLNIWVNDHFHNYGRFHYSVAESSFDTWLDGYKPGAPHRKVSIYTEGAILAWLADFIIRRNTGSLKSMDDVMRALYTEFGKNSKGYTRDDYKRLLEEHAQVNLDTYFTDFVEGTKDMKDIFQTVLAFAGLHLTQSDNTIVSERDFGFKTYLKEGRTLVQTIAPGTPAENAGLMIDDELRAVNGMRIENNLNEWLEYFDDDMLELTVSTSSVIKRIKIFRGSKKFYPVYRIEKKQDATPEEKYFYERWTKNPY